MVSLLAWSMLLVKTHTPWLLAPFPSKPPRPQVCEESALLREFLGCSSRVSNSDIAADAEVDDVSMVSASKIGGGSVKNSALTNVRCGYIEAEDCILVNVTAKRIVAPK